MKSTNRTEESTMSTTLQVPENLLETYKAYNFVVANWAIGIPDLASALNIDNGQARNILRRLKTKGLVADQHVNGEAATTWQSYFDIENEENVLENADKAFANAYGLELETTDEPVKGHGKGGGRRYTEEQMIEAKNLRLQGKSWGEVAQAVAGTKAAYHFSKAVRAFYDDNLEVEATKTATLKLTKDEIGALKGLATFIVGDGSEDETVRGLIEKIIAL